MRIVALLSLVLSLVASPLHAGLTGWSASNYLTTTANVPITAYPLLISAWYRNSNPGTDRHIAALDSSSTNIYATVSPSPSNRNQAYSWVSPTLAVAQTIQNNVPTGTWFHAMGAFVSTADRQIYSAGVLMVQSVTSLSPATPTRFSVGSYAAGSQPLAAADGVAEVSMWDGTGMVGTDRDNLAAKLAAGQNPININAESSQPWTGKLRGYYIDSTNAITDLSGNGKDLTQIGSLTNLGSHPTIDAVSGGGGPTQNFFRRRNAS